MKNEILKYIAIKNKFLVYLDEKQYSRIWDMKNSIPEYELCKIKF